MNQGKSNDQYTDSAHFFGVAFAALVILTIVLSFAQCGNEMMK